MNKVKPDTGSDAEQELRKRSTISARRQARRPTSCCVSFGTSPIELVVAAERRAVRRRARAPGRRRRCRGPSGAGSSSWSSASGVAAERRGAGSSSWSPPSAAAAEFVHQVVSERRGAERARRRARAPGRRRALRRPSGVASSSSTRSPASAAASGAGQRHRSWNIDPITASYKCQLT